MDDITVLTNNSSCHSNKLIAANNIITNHNLRFTPEELIKAVNTFCKFYAPRYAMCVLHLSLTLNERMFIAIIYALLDVRVNKHLTSIKFSHLICYNSQGHQVLGCDVMCEYRNDVIKTYCALYDHYEFDIINLQLPDTAKLGIQNHIDNKRVFTKPATK